MKPSSLLSVAAFAFLVTSASAENAPQDGRGRLPDGTAFRTDAEGNQLVDYIAELEVSIESLTRQVHGLESEVEEKQRVIERMQRSGGADSTVSERNLVGGRAEPTRLAARASDPICPPPVTCPPVVERVCPPPAPSSDCRAQTGQLEQALEQARLDLDIERKERGSDATKLQATIASLRQTVESKESEVERLNEALEEAEDSAKSYQAKLDDSNDELEAAKVKLARLEREVEDEASERVALEKQLATNSARPVSTSVASATGKPYFERQDVLNPQRLSAARSRALDSVRGNLLTEVNRVKGLVSNRDRLFASYKPAKGSPKFSMTKAVSSRNRTLATLSTAVTQATTVNELMLLRSEINEIKRKVDDDIALIARMGKRG